MPVTLADLRALTEKALTHKDNPAILRLSEKERTVEDLAAAYLPIWLPYFQETRRTVSMIGHAAQVYGKYVLPTSDPGTAHALLVALALGMGLDPGVGGLSCMWSYDAPTEAGPHSYRTEGSYRLVAVQNGRRFCSAADYPRHHALDIREPDEDEEPNPWRTICVPTVAIEPDLIRALELAVQHVLEGR